MKFLGVKDAALEKKILAIHAEAVALAVKPKKVYTAKGLYVDSRTSLDGTYFLDRLVIEFSNRLGVSAGKAQMNRMTGEIKIKLHYRLLKDNDKELRATYLHELAHILANQWYGYNCSHDDNWKQVAILLGDDGGRCHTMDVSAFRKPAKRYKYKCLCNSFDLSHARHANAQRVLKEYKFSKFSCPKCKSDLKYVEGSMIIERK